MRLSTLPRRYRAVRRAAGASLLVAAIACNFIARPLAGADLPNTPPPAQGAEADFHVDAKATLQYLASDELEGRGVGTAGLDKAADRIAEDFRKLGLKPLPGYQDYFQPFKMITSVTPDPKTALSLGEKPYHLGDEFTPLSFSGEGKFDGKIVFAGYGITSKKFGYDDYAGLDVKGKIVLAMRFEPHNAAGTSRFVKEDWSEEAHLSRKAQTAADHGAAALILVNPPNYHPDLLVSFGRSGGDRVSIPVIQVSVGVANSWLADAHAKDLKTLQADIDKDGKPASFAMETNSDIKGVVAIRRNEKLVKNVMAMRPGEGEHADEFLIIGAHYDHLGYGGPGSLAPGVRAIHHGADDNASGTTAMLELADHFAHVGPREKTLIFIAFTGEEEGLIGSNYFVNHPPIALDKVIAMLNLDMVGRVRGNIIYVGGAGTAPSFDAYLKAANVDSPLVQKSFGRGGMGPSDHMSFGLKKIPVLFLFSGLHADYHRPTDTADKINFDGIKDVVNFSVKLVNNLEDMQKEKYVDAADKDSMKLTGGGHESHVTLGIVPDYSSMDDSGKGVKISGTVAGSGAAKAGLQGGDVILQWNATKLDSLQQLSYLLADGKPGDKIKLVVVRGGKHIELEATLAERK